MNIHSVRVNNYKSFEIGEEIVLGSGFNVIIGQNNVGKSALLDAVSPRTIVSNPHRRKGKSELHQVDADSVLSLLISIDGNEFRDACFGIQNITIPVPGRVLVEPDDYLNFLLTANDLKFDVTVVNGTIIAVSNFPNDIEYQADRLELFSVKSGGTISTTNRSGTHSSLPQVMDWILQRSIFAFKAERFHVGRHAFADVSEMDQNARNLPAVLNYIQGNRPALFEDIKSQMREVFPSVSSLSVGPSNADLVVRVWSGADSDDINLSNELGASGTGIGQALAILIVAATMRPGVVVVDEINSFLHPLAIKKLTNILRTKYSFHQYIISAHAIEIIKWCDPDTVTLVTKPGEETKTTAVSRGDVSHLRGAAAELGFSVSDVFGASRILWVEGQTEEECYPLLLRDFGFDLGDGAAVVALTATSAFTQTKRAEAALAIYDRVSAVASPFTSGIVVALDRETLSDSAVDNVHRSHPGRIWLTARRTFENYILHVDALTAVINAELGLQNVTSATVDAWFLAHGGDIQFGASKKWSQSIQDEAWLKIVNGPKLLSSLFTSITQNSLEYDKKRHGLMLVRWLLEYDLYFLDPIKSYLSDVSKSMRSL